MKKKETTFMVAVQIWRQITKFNIIKNCKNKSDISETVIGVFWLQYV